MDGQMPSYRDVDSDYVHSESKVGEDPIVCTDTERVIGVSDDDDDSLIFKAGGQAWVGPFWGGKRDVFISFSPSSSFINVRHALPATPTILLPCASMIMP
jgi:hypothetical protein